jgi:hypothetical protein
MKITVKTPTESSLEDREYRDALQIVIANENGETMEFFVGDGEPEDSNLGRAFSACYKIEDMLKFAFEAGFASAKSGGKSTPEIVNLEVEDFE